MIIFTQLHTPIPLDTPRGPGWAHAVIDYGQEHELLWVIFLDESGENWIYGQRQVRLRPNITMGVRCGNGDSQRADKPG